MNWTMDLHKPNYAALPMDQSIRSLNNACRNIGKTESYMKAQNRILNLPNSMKLRATMIVMWSSIIRFIEIHTSIDLNP